MSTARTRPSTVPTSEHPPLLPSPSTTTQQHRRCRGRARRARARARARQPLWLAHPLRGRRGHRQRQPPTRNLVGNAPGNTVGRAAVKSQSATCPSVLPFPFRSPVASDDGLHRPRRRAPPAVPAPATRLVNPPPPAEASVDSPGPARFPSSRARQLLGAARGLHGRVIQPPPPGRLLPAAAPLLLLPAPAAAAAAPPPPAASPSAAAPPSSPSAAALLVLLPPAPAAPARVPRPVAPRARAAAAAAAARADGASARVRGAPAGAEGEELRQSAQGHHQARARRR